MTNRINEETRFCESIDHICESISMNENIVISKDAITILEDSLLSYMKRFSDDLESFAFHAQRNEVNVIDVIYCSTKNVQLNQSLLHFVNQMKQS
ncbi:hypothetical protein WA171_005821, partial [Blastocystis sp. BT1]